MGITTGWPSTSPERGARNITSCGIASRAAVFPKEVAEKEVSFYKTHMRHYGLPLDNRADYTKLDWSVWSATLATNPQDFQTIVDPIIQFLNKTPDRVR